MKITVLTLGSRGDVQPYITLGKALISRGHDVTLCTGGSFKAWIEANGLTFHEASIDFMEILKTDIGQSIINGGGNLFKILKYSKEVIFPLYRKTFDDFLEASRGSDLIIYHPKALGATDVAQYYNIPCLSLPPVPIIYPIIEFPNLAVSSKKSLGKFFNRLSYTVVKYGESSSMKDINDFRINTLKLNKRKMGALSSSINGKPIPILYPLSPALFEDVSSWNGHVIVSGFFYMDMQNETLDPKIQTFIEEGTTPIAISFSSMPLKNPERFKELLLQALEKTKDRAIVLTGVSGMTFEDHPSILAIESAPHRLLFKACKGIVHHGGVGTMSEALLSGVPQVIMPFNVDQPFWANRLYRLGYCAEPLHEKGLTLEHLVTTFAQFNDTDLIQRARTIASKLATEDGLGVACDYIEKEFRHAK